MNTRFSYMAIAMASLLASTATAQSLLLQVDRDSGNMILTGTDAAAVNLGGYRIGSTSGTINAAAFNGLADDVAGWEMTGDPPGADVNGVEELYNDFNGSTQISNTVSYSLGAAYNATQAMLAAGFGVEVEVGDLSLLYYDTVLNTTLGGSVEYIGEKQFNNIGITVDLANGTAIIENESPFDQTITGYLIESSTPGTLNTNLGTFDGLRNEAGGGSFQPPSAPDGENLSEVDPTGNGILIAAGSSFDLGTIGVAVGLDFTFNLNGSRTGFVKYLNYAASGDYNEDGSVNLADYTVWRDTLGSTNDLRADGNGNSQIDAGDYTAWKQRFPTSAAAAASGLGASVVPEPTSAATVLIAMIALGGIVSLRR